MMTPYDSLTDEQKRRVAPAFQSVGHRGLTVREYYAANAPAVPDWYQPERKTPSPAMPLAQWEHHSNEQMEFNSLRNGTRSTAAPEVLEFHEKWKEWEKLMDRWADQSTEERFFAWRWHYADMMIESENGQ